jgi:hypothetical protein
MTLSTTISKSGPYTGNGVTTVFPYGFKILVDTEADVIHTNVTGLETILILDTDYTISGIGIDAGGNVTYPISGSPLPATETLTIARNVPFTQDTDLVNQDTIYSEVIETSLDRSTMMIQQLQEEVDRSIKINITSPASPDDLLTSIETSESNAAASASAASSSATDSGNSATASAVSAAESAASAASVNMPTIGGGDAGKGLVVNGAEDGYDLETVSAQRTRISVYSKDEIDGLAGRRVGGAFLADGAQVTCTTLVPNDDSIPQNTEGDQVLSLPYTPLFADSTLIIEGQVCGRIVNTSGVASSSLYRDSTANALVTNAIFWSGTASVGFMTLYAEVSAVAASSTTFKVRCGAHVGSFSYNGDTAGSRLYGGVFNSFLKITEIAN